MSHRRRAVTRAVVGAAVVLAVSASVGARITDDLQLGARPQAMGGAFIAVADDINAGYWNPAGIPQLDKQALGLMHSNPFGVGEVQLNYLSYVHPTALGFLNGGLSLSYTKQSARLAQGEAEETVDMDENTYILSLGSQLPGGSLSLGANLKALTVAETDEGITRAGTAFDVGVLYQATEDVTVGLMLRNLAARLGDENFPTDTRVGIAGHVLDHKLRLAADYASKEDVEGHQGTSWQAHLGAEYWLSDTFALRLGSDKGHMTAGFGLGFQLFGAGSPEGILDYSYRQDDVLDYTHRFALSVLWE